MPIKNIAIFISLNLWMVIAVAQTNDRTVKSLVKAEEVFSLKVNKESINDAFLKFSDINCIVFRPKPVLAKELYNDKDVLGKLIWQPEFAKVAKSGDFGFTTGPYIYNNFEKETYGHYLSVWKSDKTKKWKLVLDGRITHPKPITKLPAFYQNPTNYKYPKLIGPQKIQMREDIVFSTDILLGKSLLKSGNSSLNEFYDSEVRLYFPNNLPQIGKADALKFINDQKLIITSAPTATDRAFSGDIAYTYGEAQINQIKYYYIRIWQIDAGMKWNIIIDAYLPS